MIRLFRVFIPVGALTLLLSEILLVTAAYVIAAYFALSVDPTDYLLYDSGLINIGLVLLSILIGMYLQDLYSDIYVKSRVLLLQQLCIVIGTAFLIQGFISYIDRDLRMPLRIMVLGSSISVLSIFSWRIFFTSYALQVVGRDRLLLVGGSPVLDEIARHLEEHPEMGLQVAGYVNDSPDFTKQRPGGKTLGPLESLMEIVAATNPSRIVVGMFERRNRLPVEDLLELRFAGHIIEEAANAYERVRGRVCIKELRPSQLIYSGELGPRRQTMHFQTLSNMVVAGIGIILASPFMLLTALAVRFTSAGPVLYRQVRVGLDNVPFTLYKFRSMRVDAEALSGAVWASKDDPRVTKVGRIIRKIRFDELPQLFNVLKGEMSLVGPRPERPEFVQHLCEQIPYYRQRHSVRPGITGWAQINYKYGDTLEDTISKLEYDLYYIKNMSMSLDFYIILHTMKAMLLSRGAQ
jgi:sugar transferase (PEP-CTERM system associated)